jgi:formimidoylglutamate deiminase
MYRLANRLSPDDIYSLSAFAFSEMLSTGITTVGEFHYLHHQSDGRPYEDANELGKQVLRAAQDVGIRIVLLDVAYGRGGWRKEIQKNQKRFWDKNAQTYLKRVSDLKNHLGPNQSLGLAPHSIRAVDQNWLKDIAQAQQKDFQDFPIHMHLQEQPSEIEECREEYPKKTPLQVVSEGGLLNDSFTAVHATHTTPQDRLLLAESGARVCACPTTERDLGDGFLDAKGMVEKKVEICLGTDSQVFINLWEDARELEYHARLQTLSRNVLAQNSAVFLQPCMTRNGARALRVNAGVLEPGRWADFITLDLSHPTLVGSTRDTLLTQMIFSMSPDAVCEAYVAGRKVLIDGRHAQHEKFSQAFQKVFEDVN